MAQRRERIGGFTRLADEERQTTRLDYRRAIAEFRRHIEIDRHARELFEPVARDHPGIKDRAAGDDCYSLDFRQVEIGNGQRQRLVDALEIGKQRLGDDDRKIGRWAWRERGGTDV